MRDGQGTRRCLLVRHRRRWRLNIVNILFRMYRRMSFLLCRRSKYPVLMTKNVLFSVRMNLGFVRLTYPVSSSLIFPLPSSEMYRRMSETQIHSSDSFVFWSSTWSSNGFEKQRLVLYSRRWVGEEEGEEDDGWSKTTSFYWGAFLSILVRIFLFENILF